MSQQQTTPTQPHTTDSESCTPYATTTARPKEDDNQHQPHHTLPTFDETNTNTPPTAHTAPAPPPDPNDDSFTKSSHNPNNDSAVLQMVPVSPGNQSRHTMSDILPGANLSQSTGSRSLSYSPAASQARNSNKYASDKYKKMYGSGSNQRDTMDLSMVSMSGGMTTPMHNAAASRRRNRNNTSDTASTFTIVGGQKVPKTREEFKEEVEKRQIADTTEATEESQGSVVGLILRQSIVAGPAILLLIAVIAVQFVIINEIRTTSVRQGQDLVVDNVVRAVTTFFHAKIAVIENHKYLYSTGQRNVDNLIVHPRFDEVDKTTNLPNPIELQEYEAATAPFFAKDPDLVALYNGLPNEMVWKVHRENPGMITTQLRFAGTVAGARYFERYERQRWANEPLNKFNVTKHQLKTYSVFEQGWYLWANASTNAAGEFVGGWKGPEFQGTGVGAGTESYGLEPVMVYNMRINWKQPGLYSVFKLKVLTTRVNIMLRSLDLPRNSDVALVNGAGDLAAYRQTTSQVVADPTDPTNADLATFLKVWQISRFSEVTLDTLRSNQTHFIDGNANIGIFSLDHVIEGWRIILLIDGDVLLEPYRPLLNTLLVLGIILIALSIASIVHSVVTIRQRIISSSQETRARLLDDLLPEEFAARVISRAEWPIADSRTQATVLFADMVHFTNRCSGLAAKDVIILLNHIFECWDVLSTHFGIEKIKTIGDCYMAAAGITNNQHPNDGAAAMILFAIECLDSLENLNAKTDDTIMNNNEEIVCFRFGIASGDLSIGIIGKKRFCFDIFGDTVNVASRVESNSQPNRIRVTSSTMALAKQSEPTLNFSEPEDIYVKGKEKQVTVHWVLFGETLALLQ